MSRIARAIQDAAKELEASGVDGEPKAVVAAGLMFAVGMRSLGVPRANAVCLVAHLVEVAEALTPAEIAAFVRETKE